MSGEVIISVKVCADCPFAHPERSTCHHPESKTVFGGRNNIKLAEHPPPSCPFHGGAWTMIDGPRIVRLAKGSFS